MPLDDVLRDSHVVSIENKCCGAFLGDSKSGTLFG